MLLEYRKSVCQLPPKIDRCSTPVTTESSDAEQTESETIFSVGRSTEDGENELDAYWLELEILHKNIIRISKMQAVSSLR